MRFKNSLRLTGVQGRSCRFFLLNELNGFDHPGPPIVAPVADIHMNT